MSSSDVSDVDCQDQALGFQFEPRKTLKSWSGSEWVYYETDEDVEEISSNLRTNLRILVHISYINFAPTILLKENLWTALVRMHDRKSSYLPPKDNVSNKAYRYAAYRQFTWWVHVHLVCMMSANEEELDGSDDEIQVTAKEVCEQLTEAWLNEKFSPELLETKVELVECMLAQVKELENNSTIKDKDLETSVQQIELERVKFVIASYLRERLKKIENNVIHVLEEEAKDQPSKLSPGELKFAKEFADNMQNHFNKLALQQMPANMQTLDQKKNIPRPNLDEYLFIKVNSKQEQVLIDPEEEPYTLEVDSQHIVRYKPIAAFVEDGTVSLI